MNRVRVFLRRYLRSCISCCYLFLWGWTKSGHRAFLYSMGRHFGWEPRSIGALPEVNIDDITSNYTNIAIINLSGIQGNVSLIETIAINKLIKEQQPTGVMEIGTFDGRTTLNMAANTPSQTVIYTLDLPPQALSSTVLPLAPGDEQYIVKPMSGACFFNTASASKIKQLYGDSASFDFAPYNGAISFVFVDGAHSYEYVISDSHKALELIGDRAGLVLWHDYGNPWWPDVTKAIENLQATDPRFRNIKRIRNTNLCFLVVSVENML